MNKELFSQCGIERRTFLKGAALVGATALGGSSLLVGCSTEEQAAAQAASGLGNTQAALSDGLPYGADKINPVLCGCGDVCGMLHMANCYVKDEKIVYYEGCDQAMNKGALCARGMAGMSFFNNPDRIKYPMKRTNEKGVEGTFERIGWEEALETITDAMVDAIQTDGPQSVLSVQGHAQNSFMLPMNGRFCGMFGFGAGEILGGCYNDQKVGTTATLGDYYHCLEEDPAESKLLIFWGDNAAVAKPQEWADSFWKAKRKHGTRIVCIEPRFTPTAAKADLYLPIRPGTDSYVALAMANVIITEGLQNQDFIDKHTYGYDEFKALALKYTPEEVEKISWTPADMIRQVAREYATTKPAMLCIGRGGNQAGGADSHAGWMMSRAITCLIGLTGQAGMKGAGMTMEASVGTCDGLFFHWPIVATYATPLLGAPKIVKREIPGNNWVLGSSLYYGDPCKIKVLIGWGNVAANAGGTDGMKKALKEIPLIALYSRNFNWTSSQFADIVLPTAMWTEQAMFRPDWEDLVISGLAIPPLFEAKSDNDLYKEMSRMLAQKLGAEAKPEEVWPWENDTEVCAMVASSKVTEEEYKKRVAEGRTEFEPFIGMTYEKAIQHPEGLPGPFYANLHDFVPYKAKICSELVPAGTDPEEVFFPTYDKERGSGKLLFKCDWLHDIDDSIPALPVPCEPADSYYADNNPIESGNWEVSQAVKDGYTFSAVGKGHQFWQFLSFNQGHDGGPSSSWHREAFTNASEPCVEMNARDAKRLGLESGDYVTVESPYGKMENVRLSASETIQPNTIVPPYHWGNIQNKIYPQSVSFEKIPAAWEGTLNPQMIGPWQFPAPLGGGCQCVQSAVLCKVYQA